MSQPKAQLIDPRDMGHVPVDLKTPVFDAGAIARAEEALQALSGSFQQWLQDEIGKVQAARVAAEADAWSTPALEELCTAAHDLKGLGATYDCPIATQIAGSLCRLIETDAGKARAQRDPSLARAHVDALRALQRSGIRSDEHPVGRSLLHELEARVASLGVAPR
jgi:chemotaxis protein histidine kinase CheA